MLLFGGGHAKPRPGGDETGRDETERGGMVPDATKDENQELHTVQIKNKEYKKNYAYTHETETEGRRKKKKKKTESSLKHTIPIQDITIY